MVLNAVALDVRHFKPLDKCYSVTYLIECYVKELENVIPIDNLLQMYSFQ